MGILLGRVALLAQRPIVVKLPVDDQSVGLSSALWKNGGPDLVAVWHRSDGSRLEAGIAGFGNPSTRRGTFGGEFGARHCNQWELYGVYVCDSAATRPSSQITLGRLVAFI